MKKILALILAVCLVISLAACGCSDEEATENVTETETEAAVVETENDAEEDETLAEEGSENEAVEEEKPEVEVEISGSIANTLLNMFKDEVKKGTSLTEMAEAIVVDNPIIPFGPIVMEVEEGYLNGFSNAEIKGFDAGVVFAPMIGTIPFVGYLFDLPTEAEAEAFVETLKANANLRWNVCTEADEMVVENVGDKVFFVMSPVDFEEE